MVKHAPMIIRHERVKAGPFLRTFCAGNSFRYFRHIEGFTGKSKKLCGFAYCFFAWIRLHFHWVLPNLTGKKPRASATDLRPSRRAPWLYPFPIRHSWFVVPPAPVWSGNFLLSPQYISYSKINYRSNITTVAAHVKQKIDKIENLFHLFFVAKTAENTCGWGTWMTLDTLIFHVGR